LEKPWQEHGVTATNPYLDYLIMRSPGITHLGFLHRSPLPKKQNYTKEGFGETDFPGELSGTEKKVKCDAESVAWNAHIRRELCNTHFDLRYGGTIWTLASDPPTSFAGEFLSNVDSIAGRDRGRRHTNEETSRRSIQTDNCIVEFVARLFVCLHLNKREDGPEGSNLLVTHSRAWR